MLPSHFTYGYISEENENTYSKRYILCYVYLQYYL